ncbi:MAG: hypothetical protein ACRC2T_13805 [Thermoguttaceae bacterium]
MTNGEHTQQGYVDFPVIQYNFWPIWERKITALLIIIAVCAMTQVVYSLSGKLHLALFASAFLLMSVWQLFVPIHVEVNTDGITRFMLGRKRKFSWQEIRNYVFQPEGVLILPNQVRFPLDAFRGIFIPIPPQYCSAIRQRFGFFVDH